jgi:hypothetical protein
LPANGHAGTSWLPGFLSGPKVAREVPETYSEARQSVAFKNPDGSIVAVLCNSGSAMTAVVR